MRVIYIDDSEQTNPRRLHMGGLVAIGGVIVPEGAVAAYAAALDRIRADLAIPDGEELKWNPPKGSFLAGAGGDLNRRMRRRMLRDAIDLGIKSTVVVWDNGGPDWPKERVGPEILKYLYERITMFLDEHQDVGVIIADEPGGGGKAEKQWLAATLELTNRGTRYAAPERIVSPILTAPSHHLPHLQLADLVTAATTAAVAGYPKGLELAPLLKQLARTNAHGLVGGAGVVLWPPDLVDLHHWVFGESHYVRQGTPQPLGPAAVAGAPFVQPGRTYIRDDGLGDTARPQTAAS
ncbi:DUF3800 domain-containing protein [Sinosporangium siamense]|uniref:DUF3800 domain-containing protein n=1 Tax=Sinosporangium siamense TaxID=1367973 RepID=A0A919VAE3_9ACTN|nr:DUF3800 domain-containing protein [Sinosporangium siamense]GII96348.1 hypothetical protein Ssi02_65790 [Sinosporangium siamense]